VLRTLDGGQCLVGPAGGAGDEVFSRDSSNVELAQGQGWTVNVGLSPGGESTWNSLASQCFNGLPTCPSRQLAIVLDDVVQSFPTVNEPQFSGSVSISGSFTEGEARSLSRVLNRGAFPTQVEVRRVDTVSPTLGRDSLEASIFAGLVGVALLVLVLVAFYRRLTLLIAAGMIVWGMLIYSVSVFISQASNYALTLAGVTGIVVSIGMTVDSYVVYFERMKDEVLHGRTFRNSAARSFSSTWRTILAANLVSFIAAAVLFVLSVGSVRGFALYLGVTTVCDVLVLWFFTRPAVILMAATGRLDGHDPFGVGPCRAGAHRRRRCVVTTVETTEAPRRPAGEGPVAQADPGPDGHRLLGPAQGLAAHLDGAAGAHRSLVGRTGPGARDRLRGRRGLGRAGRAAVGRRRPPDPQRQRAREQLGQDPGAQLRQRRHHQGPGRGPARGGAHAVAGRVRHGRRGGTGRGQRGLGQRHLG
jgi:preprotein translocase subunit SecD